jgi:integrase
VASIQRRDDFWRVIFRYKGRQYFFGVGKVPDDEAFMWKGKVEHLLLRLKQGLLAPPDRDDDILEWLRHDGRPPAGPAVKRVVTLAELHEDYIRTHKSSLVEKSVQDHRQRLSLFLNFLGKKCPAADLSLADLQRYVNSREGKVKPGTIKAEIIRLRTEWNWGALFYRDNWGRFPSRGLRYPRGEEKEPYMMRAEVERRIRQGGDPKALWECLYLTPEETAEFLRHLRAAARHPWVYPMAVLAAHTGARRSEMLRARVEDVDFEAGVVTVREKKRRKGQGTTRRVDMSSLLREALAERVAEVGPVPLLFDVPLETLRWGYKEAVKGSKWEVVRGWHVLRHSFISALASRGIDQRIIDDFTGHTTEEMRRRYRHLFQNVKRQAIESVFG